VKFASLILAVYNSMTMSEISKLRRFPSMKSILVSSQTKRSVNLQNNGMYTSVNARKRDSHASRFQCICPPTL